MVGTVRCENFCGWNALVLDDVADSQVDAYHVCQSGTVALMMRELTVLVEQQVPASSSEGFEEADYDY